MIKYFTCVGRVFLVAGCLLLATHVLAEVDVPLPPDLGDVIEPDQDLEPEVTIIDGGRHKIEEYRVNGRLYMIKIFPSIGPPYYLVDSDGDGEFDTQRHLRDGEMVVPRWTLFKW